MPEVLSTRRGLVQAGVLGAFGLSLPEVLRAAAVPGRALPAAKSCILFFLEGGPAQQDLWDLKPQAPLIVRGEFQPIATTVPGIEVCDQLPLLAQQMHRVALIRSVHHDIVDHNAGTYYALTGRSPVSGGRLIVRDDSSNFPSIGSVLARNRPLPDLPEFVQIPEILFNNGSDLPGQRSGFLGAGCDPLVSGDPSVPDYQIPGLLFPDGLSQSRLTGRRELLEALNGLPLAAGSSSALSEHHRKAFSLLGAARTREAFDVSRESVRIRERYGLPDRLDRTIEARQFGGLPHLGQCLLLSRRLVEAGVRLVTVATGRRSDQTWDGHREHFALLRKSILPWFDRAFSALLEDLDERGLLSETLVVAMGEFGRTPKVGQITSSAGATPAGRDHWPHCYTILMAGAGIRRGTVYGSSDSFAAYPASHPVTPADIAATIYHILGLDPRQTIQDSLNRPHQLALGEPILSLLD